MKKPLIAVVTRVEDAHALIIQGCLEKHFDVRAEIVTVDDLAGRRAISWTTDGKGTVLSSRAKRLSVRDIDVVWWRRTSSRQDVPFRPRNAAHAEVMDNDCRVAVHGAFLSEFRGMWISHPAATELAENKLVQLGAAKAAGFRVPRTLITQDPAAVRAFYRQNKRKAIVKPVRGSPRAVVLTQMLKDEHLRNEDGIRLCPAIYQEFVPGARHLRVQCFGDRCIAVMLTASNLDWRADLNVPFERYELSAHTIAQLRLVLSMLGLEMGIFDLKLTDRDELVWLEVNPQGQFLFVEALTGLDLKMQFSEYLFEAARASFQRKLSPRSVPILEPA